MTTLPVRSCRTRDLPCGHDHATGGDTSIFHTADWQLGMTRRFLGDESQAVFTADMAAVAALGELATEHGASSSWWPATRSRTVVPRSVVRAAEVPAGFFRAGLILPGNHDP